MDGMVEENGAGSTGSAVESLKSTAAQATNATSHAVAATSIVQLSLPSQAPAVVVTQLFTVAPLADRIQ